MEDQKRHDRAELHYFVDVCLILFVLFSVSTCSTEEKELPNRQFFEAHFLENLPLGSNESQFTEKFESAICRQSPHVNSPYSHWSHSKCSPSPNRPVAYLLSMPGSGTVSLAHYEAEFFYERMESMLFQFFRRDYDRVFKGLEGILGKPSKKSSKRISGLIGPTVSKNKTTIWKLSDYSIKLQSMPSSGSISLIHFYKNAYLLRLKEPFEKQLKDPTVSIYNRKHYETWINTIETDD
jgi:hypothetical protein